MLRNLVRNIRRRDLRYRNLRYGMQVTYVRSLNLHLRNLHLFLPTNFNILILDADLKFYIYIYSEVYEWILVFNKKFFKFGFYWYDIHCLFIYNLYLNKTHRIVWVVFQQFIHCFFMVFLRRIRVKGRLFRIFPGRRNILGYRFCHVHMLAIYCFDILFEFPAKKIHYMFNYDLHTLTNLSRIIQEWAPLDAYTRRGIKICGKPLTWRIGKVQRFR